MTGRLSWTVLCLFSAFSVIAQPKTKEYDLAAANISGDVMRGPRKIIAHNLNVLRYDYRFNGVVSYSQAVDLWSKLTSVSAPAPPAGGGAGPAPPPDRAPQYNALTCQDNVHTNEHVSDAAAIQHICDARKVEAAVTDARVAMNTIVGRANVNNLALASLVQNANCATETVRAGGNALKSFLLTTTGNPSQSVSGISSQLLDNGGTPCTAPGTDSTFVLGTKAQWPDPATISNLAASSLLLKNQLDQQASMLPTFSTQETAAITRSQGDLQADAARLTGTDKTAATNELQQLQNASDTLGAVAADLTKATSLNNQIQSGVTDLQQGGQKYTDFIAARDLLRTWRARMATLGTRWNDHIAHPDQNPDPFSMSIDADCEFAFSRTKTTAIILGRVDEMPGTTATNPETILSVSVECTSPFTISAGVAFTTLAEQEFGIQAVASPQGSTTTANQFVAVTKSAFHPLPIGMIHVRLWEPYEWFSLQAGFGVAGNIKSQSAGGSDADFLIGPSFALFRTMFLTPGLHLGREVSLGGGYRLGDPVPSSVTTPPLQKSYKAAFGFAVTFTKP